MEWGNFILRCINSLVLACLICFSLYVQPLLAAPLVSCAADLFQTLERQVLLHGYGRHPKSIRKTLALTGLRDKDIKDSVILDVGSFFTEEFVPYAKREMGAKQALFVGVLGIDVPQHFFLKMYPLFTEYTETGFFGQIPPFQPEQIWQKLDGTYADITFSLAVIGRHSLLETELWLRQLAKVTKDNGTIILDFGKHGRKVENISREEFEDILLRMKKKGIIASYEVQHTNRDTGWYAETSVTYKLVKGAFQPYTRLRELQRNLSESQSATSVVIPFPNNK